MSIENQTSRGRLSRSADNHINQETHSTSNKIINKNEDSSMGKLTDALAANGYEDDGFQELWRTTEAADERRPLPPGSYVAIIERGETTTVGANGTPSFKLTFRVSEGDSIGQVFWHDLWLTERAIPRSKRDLAKLGIINAEQLSEPLRKEVVCKVRLALRRDDDGTERNRVVRFDVIEANDPAQDPFAPSDEGEE